MNSLLFHVRLPLSHFSEAKSKCIFSFTGISACFSFLSLSWAIVAYTKALRTAVSKRNRVSWTGMSLQTIWRVGMVLGRITAIVLFATAYKGWTLLFLGTYNVSRFSGGFATAGEPQVS